MPKTKETKMANTKEASKLNFTILVFIFLGLITPKNKPELSLEAKEPLMFPRISRKPGSSINIAGIKIILSAKIARIVPAIRPASVESI